MIVFKKKNQKKKKTNKHTNKTKNSMEWSSNNVDNTLPNNKLSGQSIFAKLCVFRSICEELYVTSHKLPNKTKQLKQNKTEKKYMHNSDHNC